MNFNLDLVLANILTPPILFFALGMAARLLKSDLEVPQPAARFLSLYLLFAIGLKGGYQLSHAGVDAYALEMLGVAVASAFVVPIGAYAVLRYLLGQDVFNAAAIAATYGSISAVTFITATNFLDINAIPHSGFMVAAMALMESPAIIVAVLLVRWASHDHGKGDRQAGGDHDPSADADRAAHARHERGPGWNEMVREAFFNGAVLLLLGAMAIGIVCGDSGWKKIEPLTGDLFYGLLCLFLLDMGLVAARRLGDLRRSGPSLLGFGVAAPIVQACLGIAAAYLIGATPGDALLMAVLVGSASYIAVPAAMQLSVPQANPSLYVPLSLAVTFPFNIALGIPLYLAIIQSLWPEATG